jgi:hypothetical protein
VGGDGEPYVFPFVKSLHPTPIQFPGMEFRTSLGWFDASCSRKKFQSIPFISFSGKFSIHTLGVWKAYPQQVIFSLISTVYFRLLRILRKRFGFRLGRRIMNAAFKIAVVYTITRDNWIIDRFLGMARKGTPIKVVENHIHFCVSELDENKRFVYSQAYYQANWLKFQVFRPRDKSSDKVEIGSHLRNLGYSSPSQLNDDVLISEAFLRSSDLWEVTRIRSGDRGAHYASSSESLSVLSELHNFTREPEDFSWSSSDEELY